MHRSIDKPTWQHVHKGRSQTVGSPRQQGSEHTLLSIISVWMTVTVLYKGKGIDLIRMQPHICPHICHNIMLQTSNWFSICRITEMDFHVCSNPSHQSISLWVPVDCHDTGPRLPLMVIRSDWTFACVITGYRMLIVQNGGLVGCNIRHVCQTHTHTQTH